MKTIWLKIKESLSSVIPVAVIVLILNFTIAPMQAGTLALFLTGTFLLILGMSLFTLGADIAMMPMGEQMGSQLTKTKKLWLLVLICFALGVMITIAEPDLQVLAAQVPSVPNPVLILSVAIGVGLFLVVALIRILYQIRLSYLLIGFYIAVFIMAAFTSDDYLAVAFDSGGVTTGPITVPFILALGVGLSGVLGGKSSHDDSFGLVALCSIGPIMAVMIMGMFYDSSSTGFASDTAEQILDAEGLLRLFAEGFPHYFKEVGIALSPIILFFIIFQFAVLKLTKQQLIKISIGLIYTYLGLVLFLTGVNVGFMPAGNFLGGAVGSLSFNWILIPLGAIIGFFVVAAEPAVHVLNVQVQDITGGAISKRAMLLSLSIGVGIAIALAMFRVVLGVSIWYVLLPGYGLALILTLFAPKIFTAIAFDSGGVASGPMTATFLLPFTMGACKAIGGNVLTDAFGVVAMVAMTPLITIQIMGIIYRIKLYHTEREEGIAMDLASASGGEEIFEWTDGHPGEEGVEWVESVTVADDTEWVENLQWAEDLERERHQSDFESDNQYINFEE